MNAKSARVIILPPAIIFAISMFIVPWMQRIDFEDPWLSLLFRVNAFAWLLILWWAMHHLSFQIAALFKKSDENVASLFAGHVALPSLAVLYVTRDDFSPECCRTCIVGQDYPKDRYRLVICDDSETKQFRDLIDEFCAKEGPVDLVRRQHRVEFKAGNLNHAIQNVVYEEAIVIVDADQRLPTGYLTNLGRHLANAPSDVGYVQGAQRSDHSIDRAFAGGFRAVLGAEIDIFYQCNMAVRERFGFVPFVGHGAAIRRRCWSDVGGFPPRVSEDYAFAIRTRQRGWTAKYAEDAWSYESFPCAFGAFVIRLRKFAGGTAELVRKDFVGALRSGLSLVEKLDLSMLLLYFALAPVIVVNGFLSAYVCWRLWELDEQLLHPALPYMFVAMYLLVIPIAGSVQKNMKQVWKYWFWSNASYCATLPIIAWEFIVHLIKRPVFVRTPKQLDESIKAPVGCALFQGTLGCLALLCAWAWWSPFSPFLAGQGVAYLCFPLYFFLGERSGAGMIAGLLAWMPGALMLIALYTLWNWGRGVELL